MGAESELSFEETLVAESRALLIASLAEPLTPAWGRIRLDRVYLDVEAAIPTVIVLFRDTSRKDCQFGFRFPTRFEEEPEDEQPEDPGFMARVLLTNLEEEVEAVDLGLPSECKPGEITWLH